MALGTTSNLQRHIFQVALIGAMDKLRFVSALPLMAGIIQGGWGDENDDKDSLGVKAKIRLA